MANDIILKEYETLLGQISTLESRLSTIISQTSSALSTINTSYDLIETESQESDYDNFGGFLLNTLTMGISGQVHKHQQISEINSDIEYDIDRCRSALGNLNKYVSSGAGLFATFRGVFDGLYNADSLSAEDIQNILTGYNLTTCFSPVGASTSLSEIRDRTEVTSFDVKKHDSYGTMSLRQAIFGDFSDDSTMAGAGMGLVLQFIPFVDTACDIRDVAADGKNIYKYETSNDKSWGKSAEVYGFTTLDVAAFIPFVGALKYTDEIADGAKAMDKVHDVSKSIDKVNDARKQMSKIDDIADAAKGAQRSTEAVSDIAKGTGSVVDTEKSIKKGATIADSIGDTAKGTDKISDSVRHYDKSVLNSLDNTDNFRESTVEHIFDGQVKRGTAQGYHYDGIDGSAGRVVDGTQTNYNKFGAYDAIVEVNGLQKSSSMFPDDWTPQEVIDSINEAYADRLHWTGNTWYGSTSDGMSITMFLDKDNKIISAFPTITIKPKN